MTSTLIAIGFYLLGAVLCYGITYANMHNLYPELITEYKKSFRAIIVLFCIGSWLSIAITILEDGFDGFYWGGDYYD